MLSQAKSIKSNYVSYQQGPPSGMKIDSREVKPAENEVLMKIKAIGLNRAQTLQRQGKYPAKNQTEKLLGLEASGQVYDPNTNEKLYDGIALLSGGSYAQWASIPKTHIMKCLKSSNLLKQKIFSQTQGAGIPEAWLTAFQLIRFANLQKGQSLVVYACASGVGTAAIQMCNLLGFNAFGVCSTAQKGKICKQIGVKGISYYKQNQNWADDLIKQNDGKPFTAVLDCIGSNNVNDTIKLLGSDGRWVLYGLLSGGKTDLNLASLLAKRINLISTTLKARSKQYKDELIQDFSNRILGGFDEGKLKPIIDSVIENDWKSSEAFIKGHQLMENNQNAGKIIIKYL